MSTNKNILAQTCVGVFFVPSVPDTTFAILFFLLETVYGPPLKSKKVKQSRYTPWKRLGGEDVYLLLIHDLGIRWG
jgi:hypothetical protein